MMYPFMTLPDDTEITHSELLAESKVRVYVEKPDAKDGFHNAVYWLPDGVWENINGFTEEEINQYNDIIQASADIIMELAEKGGFQNASNL